MSNFNYCSLVWHACGVKNTRKLEKLQERALRFVYLDKVSSYDDLLTKANLTTLHLGRLKMLATEVYKSVHKLNPPYIQDIYKTKTTVTNRRLRRQNNLQIPRVNSTTYGLNSLAYQGAKIWNGLTQDLQSAISLNSFKGRGWSKTGVCHISVNNQWIFTKFSAVVHYVKSHQNYKMSAHLHNLCMDFRQFQSAK